MITDSFSDAEGKTVSGSTYGLPGHWPDELLISLTFEEQNGKTYLTLEQRGTPEEMTEQTIAGWNESLDKLAESLK